MNDVGQRAKAGEPTPMWDWIVAGAVFAAMMLAVWLGWSNFPRPRNGGGLILGAVAVVATMIFFGKSKAGLPIWPRASGFAVTVLIAQAAIQAAAAIGLLEQ